MRNVRGAGGDALHASQGSEMFELFVVLAKVPILLDSLQGDGAEKKRITLPIGQVGEYFFIGFA